MIVQGSIGDGTLISFFANGSRADCYDVHAGGPWQPTYPFTSGALTELNLRVTETAQFYSIDATAGIGGSIAPTGRIVVNPGDNVTFTISPLSGYAIQNVAVDGILKGVVPVYTFEQISANHTIAATFSQTSSGGGWRWGGGGGGGGNGGSYPTTTMTTVPTTGTKGTIYVSSGDGVASTTSTNDTVTIVPETLETTPVATTTLPAVQSFWDQHPRAWLIPFAIAILLLAGLAYYTYRKEHAGSPPGEK